MKPRIFLSAVTQELHSARQLGANILTRLGYEPVWQDIFGTEGGDLRQMLRDKIDSCEGLIHLVGFGYGAEPTQADPNFGRVSYTQFEYCYARKTGKKTWIFFVQDGYPADLQPDQLDLPPAGHPDRTDYRNLRRGLQDAWRVRLNGEGQLYHAASTAEDFQLKFERLKDEWQGLRRGFRAWQRVVVGLLLLLLVAGGILCATVIRNREDVHAVGEDVKKVQESIEKRLASIRPDDIKKQLRNTIEATYEHDLQEAGKLADWKKRDEAKKDARDSRDKRLGQAEEFLTSITSSITSGEATPELLEFTHILQDQGPADAVKYIDGQEQRLLADAEKLTQKRRRTVLPILEAAKVNFNRGELPQARKTCEKLLAQDGDWPEALYQHALVMEELGNRALKYDRIENAQVYFQALEKSARRRWELDPKDVKKQHDLSISFIKLGDVSVTLGRIEDGLKYYEDGLKIRRQLADADPKDAQKQRALSVSFISLGDVCVKLGRTEEGLKYYEEDLKISHRLADADPKDAQKQRYLSISFNRLGDVCVTLGRSDDGLKYFLEDLKISRQLADADPSDAQKQRDLSVSFISLGDVFVKLGRTADALKYYDDSLKISRQLADADPQDAQKQRDLSISFNRLGDVCVTLGRSDDGLKYYQEDLKISRQLAAADPKNAEKQRDLSISIKRLGNACVTLGRTEDGLKYCEEDLKISRQLAAADPKDAEKQRDLSISFIRLGEVFVNLGRTEDGKNCYEDGLIISRQLAAADPKDAQKQRDLMVGFHRLGGVRREVGDYEAAIQEFERGVTVLEKLIEAKLLVESSGEEKAILQRAIKFCRDAIVATGEWEVLLKSDSKQLPPLLSLRATELAKRGRLKDVEQTAAKLREFKPTSDTTLYDAGCAYGLCAALAVKGKTRPTEDDLKLKKKFADLALACLKEAIAAGYKNFAHMKQDSDLAALRDLPEFQASFPKK